MSLPVATLSVPPCASLLFAAIALSATGCSSTGLTKASPPREAGASAPIEVLFVTDSCTRGATGLAVSATSIYSTCNGDDGADVVFRQPKVPSDSSSELQYVTADASLDPNGATQIAAAGDHAFWIEASSGLLVQYEETEGIPRTESAACAPGGGCSTSLDCTIRATDAGVYSPYGSCAATSASGVTFTSVSGESRASAAVQTIADSDGHPRAPEVTCVFPSSDGVFALARIPEPIGDEHYYLLSTSNALTGGYTATPLSGQGFGEFDPNVTTCPIAAGDFFYAVDTVEDVNVRSVVAFDRAGNVSQVATLGTAPIDVAMVSDGTRAYWNDPGDGDAGSGGLVVLDTSSADVVPQSVSRASAPGAVAIDDHYVYWFENTSLDMADGGSARVVVYYRTAR